MAASRRGVHPGQIQSPFRELHLADAIVDLDGLAADPLELLVQPAAVLGQQDVTLACLSNGEVDVRAGAVTPSRGQQRAAAESPSVGLVVETAPRREEGVARASPQRQGGTWERQLFHVGTPSYSGTSAARLRRRILPGKRNSDRCKAATSYRQV